MVSYSLILSTENGTQTTRGNPADYTWGFDWSEFEDGNYEMIYTFLSDNLNQVATFNDVNRPCVNLDLGGILPNAFEVVDTFTSRRSQHIGFLRSEIQSTTNGIFLSNVKSDGSNTLAFYDNIGNPEPINLINGQTYTITQVGGVGGGGDTNTGNITLTPPTYTATATGQLTKFDVNSNQLCAQLPVAITAPVLTNVSPALGGSYITTTVQTATTATLTFNVATAIYLDVGNYTLTGNAGAAIGTLAIVSPTTYAAGATVTFTGTAKSLALGSPVVFTPTPNIAGGNYPQQATTTNGLNIGSISTVPLITTTTSQVGVNTNTLVVASTTLLQDVIYIVYSGTTTASPQIGLFTGGVSATTSITFNGIPISYASGASFSFYPASNLNIVNGVNYNTLVIQSAAAAALAAGKTYNVKIGTTIYGTVVGDGNISRTQFQLTSSILQITPNAAFSFVPLFVAFASTTLLANITYSQFIGTNYIGDVIYPINTAVTSIDTNISPTNSFTTGTMVSFIPPTTQVYIPAGATLLTDIVYRIRGTNFPVNPAVINFTGTGVAVYTFILPVPAALYGNTDITFIPYQIPVQNAFASTTGVTGFSFTNAQTFTTAQVGTYNASGEGIEATYDPITGAYSPTVAISLGTGVVSGTFSTNQNIINQNIELSLVNGSTTGVCQLYTNINDNPPVYYRILGNTTGKIRVWLTSPASLGNANQNQNSFSVPSLGNWSMVLRFTKVDKVKNSSSYQVVDDVLFSK